MMQTEKESPWQNIMEVEICELKRHARRLMTYPKHPEFFYGIFASSIQSICAKD